MATIQFNLSEGWAAQDLATFIDDVDFMYSLLALSTYGSDEARHLLEEQTGSDQITPGNIRLILPAEYRLKVHHVSIASPGLISFEGLGEVIKELRETLKELLSAPSQFSRVKREARKIDAQTELLKKN